MHFTEDKQRFEIIEDIPASNDRNGSDVPIRRVLYLRDRRPRFCNDSKKGCGGALEYRDFMYRFDRHTLKISILTKTQLNRYF